MTRRPIRIRSRFLVLSFGLALSPLSAASQSEEVTVPVEVTTVGVDLESATPIAILRDRTWGQLVPISIESAEADAIGRILMGVHLPAPMTHDLLASVIDDMGGAVEEVVVKGDLGVAYMSRIRIRVGSGPSSEVHELVSRPSDALALALRTGAVIRVAQDLIQSAPQPDFVAFEGHAHVVRAMGVTVAAVTHEHRAQFSLPERDGLVVLNVSKEMEERGLRRGDLLVEVDGQVPLHPLHFLRTMGHAPPSGRLKVVYVRDGMDQAIVIPSPVERQPDPDAKQT